MTDKREAEAEPHFSQPVRQISSMLIVVALVGAGFYVVFNTVVSIFWTNPYLNGVIFGVFALGVLACFRQVIQLMNSVSWIEAFARSQQGQTVAQPPSLLAPLVPCCDHAVHGCSFPPAPAGRSLIPWPSASTRTARLRGI